MNIHCRAGEVVLKTIKENNPAIFPLVYGSLVRFDWAKLSLHDVIEIFHEIDPELEKDCQSSSTNS